ncbi:MAG: hypothetical protein EBS51_01000 [Planctomycetia bacterium]|nr:hypothetical protein [Planctomycetia bacterium]
MPGELIPRDAAPCHAITQATPASQCTPARQWAETPGGGPAVPGTHDPQAHPATRQAATTTSGRLGSGSSRSGSRLHVAASMVATRAAGIANVFVGSSRRHVATCDRTAPR